MTARSFVTVGEYRRYMVERLFGAMLSTRLDEIAQAPNAPFLGAATGRSLFVNTAEITTLDALVANGGVEPWALLLRLWWGTELRRHPQRQARQGKL